MKRTLLSIALSAAISSMASAQEMKNLELVQPTGRPYLINSKHSPKWGYFKPMQMPYSENISNPTIEFKSQAESMKIIDVARFDHNIKRVFGEVATESLMWFYAQDKVSYTAPIREGNNIIWWPIWGGDHRKRGFKITIPEDYNTLVSQYAEGVQKRRTCSLINPLDKEVVECKIKVDFKDKSSVLTLEQRTKIRQKHSDWESDLWESEIASTSEASIKYRLDDVMAACKEILNCTKSPNIPIDLLKEIEDTHEVKIGYCRLVEKGHGCPDSIIYTVTDPTSNITRPYQRFIMLFESQEKE